MYGQSHQSVRFCLCFAKRLLKNEFSCKIPALARLFPARAIALSCVHQTLLASGLDLIEPRKQWVEEVSKGNVDVEDFDEVLETWRDAAIQG